MKHLTEEDLIRLYYGESGAPDGARDHLGECRECSSAAESLAATLKVCSEWNVPEPGSGFERSVWARLVPQMPGRDRTGWFRVWVAAAAMAALIAIAFIAGRTTPSPQPSLTAGLSSQARQRILEISLADHLDRAAMLLTEISNATDTDAEDFSSDRARAQDLVEEGRLMRQLLASQGESATLAFLDEVERFMLEVANSPDKVGPEEIHRLQRRIGAGSLLFKVRIIESNLRNEGQKS
ncbi:MAG: hypothetical protein ABSB15_14240 [Bryobacteraceae bacterium]|jgi:hypothetical protein